MKKLTYEFCKKEVLKYKTRHELITKQYNIYRKIMDNKWYELIDSLKPFGKDTCYLKTKEDCAKIVAQYETLKELRENDEQFYRKIIRSGWKDLFDNLKISFGKFKRNIYVYEFKNLNTAYIGLTYDVKKRDYDHHRKGSVFEFTKKMRIKEFAPKILEENIDYDKAGKIESFYIEKYKKEGWKLLNKAPAGSLGGDVLKKEIIVCFDKNGELKKIANIEYFVENNFSKLQTIRICLRKTNKSTNTYRFFRLDEWEKMGKPQKIEPLIIKNEVKEICILSDDFSLIKLCKDKNETMIFLNYREHGNNTIAELKEGIIVRGKKTYWVCYYKDYIKYKNNEITIVKPTIPKCKKLVFVDNKVNDKIDYANSVVKKIPQYKINQLKRQKEKK